MCNNQTNDHQSSTHFGMRQLEKKFENRAVVPLAFVSIVVDMSKNVLRNNY